MHVIAVRSYEIVRLHPHQGIVEPSWNCFLEEESAMANKAEQKSIKVQVKFQGQQKGQELPSTRAYLFDRTGHFIDSKLVEGKPLSFSVDAGPKYQLRIGP